MLDKLSTIQVACGLSREALEKAAALRWPKGLYTDEEFHHVHADIHELLLAVLTLDRDVVFAAGASSI